MKPTALSLTLFLLLIWEHASSAQNHSIYINNVNGVIRIKIDGQQIDLKKARVINETSQETVLEAAEIPGVKITINKLNGKQSVDYNGYHYESLVPEEINRLAEQNVEQINQQIHSVQQQIASTWGFLQGLF